MTQKKWINVGMNVTGDKISTVLPVTSFGYLALAKKGLSGMNDNNPANAGSFKLSDAYPNPFNPSTKISYSLPNSGKVTLRIINSLGEVLETLLNEEKSAGDYEIVFDARNYPSGVYFYQMEYGGVRATKKMIVLK
jgi:hypothetical protein